eukprot:CAMPEP_0170514712 /NCGR_PEP_ID=MMETSP0209-20121228/1287_1 /TAXON_ID=665100 ORGANISM="Litonotus pictus, Strain P1" /NCGR_SAMPLE_ID=MMETSP0209 /ASSEMBLY_ACC=CAM_ASM_000301 /LENGTH=253 /DNA_ID=CAMNT_0010798911 /DNA_START=81 /DNA_END=842 /DNA_ORIENTATION=-
MSNYIIARSSFLQKSSKEKEAAQKEEEDKEVDTKEDTEKEEDTQTEEKTASKKEEEEEDDDDEIPTDPRFKYKVKEEYKDQTRKLKEGKDTEEAKIETIKCTSDNCSHGKCIDEEYCVCHRGYASYKITNFEDSDEDIDPKDKIYCDYQMKEQIVAFLLETIFILGFGHLYAGRIVHGVLKMLIILLFVAFDLLLKSWIASKSLKTKNFYYTLSLSLYFGLLVFQLLDIVMLGLNKYHDGNGMPFYFYSSLDN